MTRFRRILLNSLFSSFAFAAIAAGILTLTGTSSSLNAAPAPQGTRISCSSDDMHHHFCQADTRGGVRMVHQRSEAKCIFNRSWGYDDRGIWVDRGCRADFEVRVRD